MAQKIGIQAKMKAKHKKEAETIGADSYELIHFNQLPINATTEQQIEALKKDQNWQNNHIAEISSRIDDLISDIEFN